MPSVSVPNRRQYFRQPMFLRVDVRVAGLRVAIPATLVDLSAGGCQLQARTMLKPHTAVEFSLPRHDGGALRLPGKLVKVQYVPTDRSFRYAVSFDALSDDVHDALLRFVSEEQRRAIATKRGTPVDEPTKTIPTARLQEVRAHKRVDVNMPVRYTISEMPGTFSGTAIDVGTGGIRVITEHVLRQEWTITLRFTLPNAGRGAQPQRELRAAARALPGVKESRGRYVQSLAWHAADPRFTEEIDRFVHAMRAATLKR